MASAASPRLKRSSGTYARPAVAPLADASRRVTSSPVERDPCPTSRAAARDELRELRLAVAGHPRDADDLAARGRRGRCPGCPGPADRSSSQRRARPGSTAPAPARTAGRDPTISRASSPVVGRRVASRIPVTRPSRSTVMRSAIAHDLVELVADEDGRPARGAQLVDDPEQALGLLGVRTAVGSSRMSRSAPR